MSTKMNTDPFAFYTSPNGLQYRVTGIEIVEGSERWINGVLRYHWITSICFIETDKRISLEYDYSEKVIRKIV
jgi:hypothetical protein